MAYRYTAPFKLDVGVLQEYVNALANCLVEAESLYNELSRAAGGAEQSENQDGRKAGHLARHLSNRSTEEFKIRLQRAQAIAETVKSLAAVIVAADDHVEAAIEQTLETP